MIFHEFTLALNPYENKLSASSFLQIKQSVSLGWGLWRHCVVFLATEFTLAVPLFTQVYEQGNARHQLTIFSMSLQVSFKVTIFSDNLI